MGVTFRLRPVIELGERNTNDRPTPQHADRTISARLGRDVSRYKIRGELGVGGMGTVYEAEDSLLGRQVAIKTLKHEEAGDPPGDERRVQRFQREAITVKGLPILQFGFIGRRREQHTRTILARFSILSKPSPTYIAH